MEERHFSNHFLKSDSSIWNYQANSHISQEICKLILCPKGVSNWVYQKQKFLDHTSLIFFQLLHLLVYAKTPILVYKSLSLYLCINSVCPWQVIESQSFQKLKEENLSNVLWTSQLVVQSGVNYFTLRNFGFPRIHSIENSVKILFTHSTNFHGICNFKTHGLCLIPLFWLKQYI